MDIDSQLSALRSSLKASAALGDSTAKGVADAICATAEPALKNTIVSLCEAIANDIDDQLREHSVFVQIRDGAPVVVVTEIQSPAGPSQHAKEAEDDGAPVRTTLRIPVYLRDEVDRAANEAGVSVNTWILEAIRTVLNRNTRQARPSAMPSRSSTKISGWYS